jgi:hypothetical protein
MRRLPGVCGLAGHTDTPRTARLTRAEKTAGMLSLLAGAIHGGVTPTHFDEWWGYGIFFIFAAAAQLLLGLAILTNAINPNDTGPRWRRWRRWMYWTGIVGNALIIILYVVTRTVGIPPLGPEAGEVEPVAAIDVVSKATEVALIVVLAVLLWKDRAAAADEPGSAGARQADA